jgi:hypothetical protein
VGNRSFVLIPEHSFVSCFDPLKSTPNTFTHYFCDLHRNFLLWFLQFLAEDLMQKNADKQKRQRQREQKVTAHKAADSPFPLLVMT